MATSIGKLSKSFFVKVLVGIIILPFVFWGMGDVFRGGNQNVIATIDSKKVSTQEFMKYLSRLDLNQEDKKNLQKTDLIEKILSEYIGQKVMALEIKKLGISVNDNSLRDIIKNDKIFFKDNKFSRTEYEKFLLKSGITAPAFEANIAEQETRRQLLSFLAGGLIVPDVLVENSFKKENQIKYIKYIDLKKFHSSKKPSQEKIKELYEKNKNFFTDIFKSLKYAEITPLTLTGNVEYDETFFNRLDDLENNILDGQSFDDAVKKNNLKLIIINKTNKQKLDKNKNKIKNLPDNLFKKIFSIKIEKSPEIINIDSKYFLAEIDSIEKINKSMDDPDVLKTLYDQLNFNNKIENNRSLVKDISMGAFNENKMKIFANENKLELKEYKISDLKQNKIFSEGIIRRIFLTKNDEINLITDSSLNNSFLILTVNTEYKKLKKSTPEFEKFEAKARLNLINRIYKTFDEQLNAKYKVELNQKTIERVKNSF